ncbi:MAG: ABC transporter permease, partial [Cytophagales bacterium]
VLGASVRNIVFMFSKEFLVLIALGFLLAVPFAWYGMSQWLENFSYKIDMGPATFLAGFAITILIAVLTVGYRSFKAAVVNPAQSLRSE